MPKPNWIVYKNEQAISQGVSWHKALSNLVIMEGLTRIEIGIHSGLITVLDTRWKEKTNGEFKIVQER